MIRCCVVFCRVVLSMVLDGPGYGFSLPSRAAGKRQSDPEGNRTHRRRSPERLRLKVGKFPTANKFILYLYISYTWGYNRHVVWEVSYSGADYHMRTHGMQARHSSIVLLVHAACWHHVDT